MNNYITKFDRIVLINRWKQRKYSRGGDWVIIGIHRWYASWDMYCYKLCFFGFDLCIWLKILNKGKIC